MTERIRIGQLRIRAAGGARVDAARLGEHIAASLRDAAGSLESARPLGAVRIRVSGAGNLSELGSEIARAIIRSLR